MYTDSHTGKQGQSRDVPWKMEQLKISSRATRAHALPASRTQKPPSHLRGTLRTWAGRPAKASPRQHEAMAARVVRVLLRGSVALAPFVHVCAAPAYLLGRPVQ